ncbi:MAG: alpha-2-macroglobulin [Magnetococcales bacterium]|nr:alpha-2-macroglobulin [Magnetococcales bacterium]
MKRFSARRILSALFLGVGLTALLFLPVGATSLSATGDSEPETAPASVEHFSPQGTIKRVRQVSARFSVPMVSFGDPRLPDPFEITCPAPGKGRWADSRNWVYDFEQDLPAGVKCHFALKSGLHSLAGASVTNEAPFVFSTGGPAVMASFPQERSIIDEEQIFILGLDAPAEKASILANAYCEIPGVGEKVGLDLLEGAERRKVLQETKGQLSYFLSLVFRDTSGRQWRIQSKLPKGGTDRERFLDMADKEDAPLVVAKCRRRLPTEAKVGLVWGEGIRTASGEVTEHSQQLSFTVRKGFTAEFSCQRANKDAGCMPMLPLIIHYSAPVSRHYAERVTLKDSHNNTYKNSHMIEKDKKTSPIKSASMNNSEQYVEFTHFFGPFPESSQFTLEFPPEFKDDAGRELENRSHYPLAVRTDQTPALIKFPGAFGIVEAKGDATLPVTVRNLEAVLPLDAARSGSYASEEQAKQAAQTSNAVARWWDNFREKVWPKPAEVRGQRLRVDTPVEFLTWMNRVTEAQKEEHRWDGKKHVTTKKPGGNSVFQNQSHISPESFILPRPEGGKPFEVLGIPFKNPGYYIVELASDRLGSELHGDKKPYYVQTAVLVTNLSVHFKYGNESSLVWVTTLDQGKPVAGAEVRVGNCGGQVYFTGQTDGSGVLAIPQQLPQQSNSSSDCLRDYQHLHAKALLVSAKLGEDQTFLLSTWNQGISSNSFGNSNRDNYNSTNLNTTVFDRTLLKAGETVSMKHFARQGSGNGIILSTQESLPNQAIIRHTGSGQEYKLPLKWDEANTAENQWPIPKEAKAGRYDVVLKENTKSPHSTLKSVSGNFSVESYRVPTMKAVLNPVESTPVNPGQVAFDLRLSYLSGGAAGYAPVKLRGLVRPKTLQFNDYDGFVFSNGQATAEENHSQRGLWSRHDDDWDNPGSGESSSDQSQPLPVQSLLLGAGGTAQGSFPMDPTERPRELQAEMEYQDANGERLTSSTRVTLYPSQVVLGLKTDRWTSSQDQFKFQIQALNTKGQPAAGVNVSVDLLERKYYSNRKRLLGGFYAYDNHSEINKLSDGFCRGVTDNLGKLFCDTKSPVAGNIILQAKASDAEGRTSYVNTAVWVVKQGELWFGSQNNDRMDLLPEKKRWEPGEEALLQVRMPFREATALVTVEREGVLDHFVQHLSGQNPVVKVPMRGHYAPNVFVSVLAVRGRSGAVQPTALVDLGKPAFRLGYAELNVGWKAHELGVKVSTDQPLYKVRQQAQTLIQVTSPDGKPLPAGAEVALAAVDEGLLELKNNTSWNLLSSMMRRRSLEIQTATAQMQVIGRRHYGRKAVSPGGGGGKAPGRQLLDTLLSWQPRVKLDENGTARVAIPLNDALSSFRVVAIAHAGEDLFGTGSASFRTSQDLMLFSGISPMVREQDTFRAAFTLRNSSDQSLKTALTGTLITTFRTEGGESTSQNLSPQEVELSPGESREVWWETMAPLDGKRLSWTVEAVAGEARDKLTATQEIVQSVPVRVFQATLTSLENPTEIPVEIPADAIPGRGGLRVQFQDRLTAELSGVKEYMSRYPYTCLEQNVSKAVALQDGELWRNVMNSLPSYLDDDGLARYFPILPEGSDTLTAYILSLAHDNGWTIPDETRKRMASGLWRFAEGKILRSSDLPAADLTLRKLAALEALSRHGKLPAEQLTSLSIEPNLWPTSGVIDWLNLLNRSGHWPDQAKRRQEAVQILRSRLNFQGTGMSFSTERSDYLWWLMISADSNANRLILALLKDPQWKEDMPRLVRGALGRMQNGHWSTTTADAWGVTAMKRFTAAFESEPVSGESAAFLGDSRQILDWNTQPHGKTLELPWPKDRSVLALEHRGTGRPWVTLQSRAAIPLKEPLSTGYRIQRSVTPVEQKSPGVWSRGDVMRVRLDLEAQSDMTWVVVNDPIPAGGTILGTGLAKDSSLLTRGENRQGWVRPAFEERTFEAFHAYYRWVPKGKWTVEYSVRLNNPGHFSLPPSRVEAMYAPEMLGELPVDPVTVVP